MSRNKLVLLCSFGIALISADVALGQSARVPPRRNSRYSSGYSAPSTNPTQNILNRPTVSPYLNLLNGLGGNPGGYQSFVRPFAEQGRAVQQNQRQIGALQNSFNASQQSGAAAAGAGGLRPTGHQIFYRNFSHYYPNMPR